MLRTVYVALLALLIQSAPTMPQHSVEVTLDVLGIPPPPPQTDDRLGGGCVCGSASDGDHAAPVKVTLDQISPESLSIADQAVVYLHVDLVGNAPMLIALSRDPHVAPPTCPMAPGDVRTSFALLSGRDVIAASPMLYGSRPVPATTMTLNPGERLRVRVPMTISSIDRTRSLLEDPQALQVRAALDLQSYPCRLIFEYSPSALPVLLSRPKTP